MTEITVEKVRELDAARTQGEWQLEYYLGTTSVVAADEDTICNNERYYPVSVSVENQNFIAAAPAMAALIIKQSEQLTAANALVDKLAVTLGDCRWTNEILAQDYNNPADETYHLARKALEGTKQALAEIQQFKQGGSMNPSNNDKIEELKPCPFCNQALVIEPYGHRHPYTPEIKCPMNGICWTKDSKDFEAWNRKQQRRVNNGIPN